MTVRDRTGAAGRLPSRPAEVETAAAERFGTKPRRPFWKRSERAQATTEFIVIFPALLLLFFLMLEFGWHLKNYIVVTNAGREAARCAAVNNCRFDGAIATAQQIVEERIIGGVAVHPLNQSDIQFSIHWIDQDGNTGLNRGDSLVVCIESPSRIVTPLGVFASYAGLFSGDWTIPLRAREEMRVERAYTGSDLNPTPQGSNSCSPS